jgi:hypothetical protein
VCCCCGNDWASTGGLLAEGAAFTPFSTEVASQPWLHIVCSRGYFSPLFSGICAWGDGIHANVRLLGFSPSHYVGSTAGNSFFWPHPDDRVFLAKQKSS